MGHNVVIDGYNTNDYYHLNFGWGGSYNGWYLLPSQIPYGLTVVEGAIVDIIPHQYVFTVPDTLVFHDSAPQTLEIINLHSGAIVLEDLVLDAHLQNPQWQITPSSPLPATIPENGMMSIQIVCSAVDRDYIDAKLRLILDQVFSDVPIRYSSALSVDDNPLPSPPLKARVFPNPFSESCKVAISNPNTQPLTWDIYNLKGQKVYSYSQIHSDGNTELEWNGRNMDGFPCAAGIYLYKITGAEGTALGSMLRIK